MQPKFLYVFNTQDRDELLKMGYVSIYSNLVKNVFIFKNNQTMTFDNGEHPLTKKNIKFVATDVMTF